MAVDRPPPLRVRPLQECRQQFHVIQVALQQIATDVRALRDATIRHDEALRGVWHELRDNLRVDVRALSDALPDHLRAHQADCPARQAALQRLQRPPAAGGPRLPRGLWYLCCGLGVVVATAAYLLSHFGVF
jgi:hypothetical protein